jgi:hypothetical protein
MHLQSICNIATRRHAAVAVVFAALPFLAGAQALPAGADDANTNPVGRQRVSLYSVVNLGPGASSPAVLNERGQAAFTSLNYFGDVSRFFDGERLHPIGSLGGDFTWVWALNNHGVVVGDASTGGQPSRQRGFAWTLAGGLRALPGEAPAGARDINDRNEIVGSMGEPGVAERAVRWNPDGGITPLGPLVGSLSQAFDINNRGYATGFSAVAGGESQAVLWDPAGNQTDVGPGGRGRGYGLTINERNEVAGEIDYNPPSRRQGFFWSRDTGIVPVGFGANALRDMNNRGEIIGDTSVAVAAFEWSLARGLVYLPVGAGGVGQAADINDHGEVVGSFLPAGAEAGAVRAVRWPSFAAAPIELNTRLYRAPAGLELSAAVAINDSGYILANSNAGLVLLRPGRRGTDAPVLGPIAGLPTTVELGRELTLTIGFVDNASAETHTASVLWADGCDSPAPTVSEAGGVGQVRLQHRFCGAGYHAVRVRVTDSGGRYTELERDFYVEAPELSAPSGK